MNIFDYLFYRTYLINKNNSPFITGVMAVWFYVMLITGPLTFGFIYLFYFKEQNNRLMLYPFLIIIWCLLTRRYKKKEKDILLKYKNCLLNKLPNWAFGVLLGGGLFLLCFVSVYILKHYVEPFMWEHDLMGRFHEYLPSFMILD